MKRRTLVALTTVISATLLAGCQTKSSDPYKIETFGNAWELPDSLPYQPNDATIFNYYLKNDIFVRSKYRSIEIPPSSKPFIFTSATEENSELLRVMAEDTVLSYLYYEDGVVIYDALPPKSRFRKELNNQSYFSSNSVGKSITSYMLGHAICKGYIESVNEKIDDWSLIENTLYFNQPLLNVLNMKAGDAHIFNKEKSQFKNSGRGIHQLAPLISAVNNPDELLNTVATKNPSFSYSNLAADILMNYMLHRAGDDFDDFITEFYQEKVKIEHPIYMITNELIRTEYFGQPIPTKTIREQGAGTYMLYATRYDYLRIAKAILDDWQNDTCEGQYLKKLYELRVPTNRKANWNDQARSWGGYMDFEGVSRKYAGQFWTEFPGLTDRHVLGMSGYNGQQIIIDMDNSRIVVISAAKMNNYSSKKIGFDPIKYGRIQ